VRHLKFGMYQLCGNQNLVCIVETVHPSPGGAVPQASLPNGQGAGEPARGAIPRGDTCVGISSTGLLLPALLLPVSQRRPKSDGTLRISAQIEKDRPI
jgi:hypothetical protein